MRLTLRTMLAHMDGILDPEDNEDIERKIAASEFASNLMHRIRDVVRRLRLGAPGLGGRGPALDPNTVAEYLDNALHDNQVADFEKVCLESDMQLAEVAASHQVLALVLGEPVEIDPAARQRMYQLPSVASETEKALEARRREKPGVPDYLREPPRKSRLGWTVALLAVAGCVFITILAATGSLDPWLEHAGIKTAKPDVAEGPQVPETLTDGAHPTDGAIPADPATGPVIPGQPTAPPETDRPGEPAARVAQDAAAEAPSLVSETPSEAMPSEVPAAPAEGQPRTPTLDLAQPMAALPDAVKEPAPAPDNVSRPALLPESGPMPAPEPRVLAPGTETPADPRAGTPSGLLPGEAAMDKPRNPAPMPEGSLPGILAPSAPDGPAPPAERPEQISLGRLASDRQLLLQYDSAADAWNRVTMQTAIQQEYPLLALPTYRPVVAFSAGVTAQLVGPLQAELHPLEGDQMPMLEVAYGRLIMHTLGQAGSRIRLAIGERLGIMTFAEADSGVAIYVYRSATPGNDPESGNAPLVADLWVTRGRVVWQTDGGQPVNVDTSSHISLGSAASEPPEPKPEAAPGWVSDDQSSLIDKRASAVLVDEIQVDRPATLALREVAGGHRQREVRWLAVRCLGHLGQFDPMVAVLDEEDSKTVWFDYIDELRAAMARAPRLASAVRESLQRHYGPDAEKMYRMLWGYSSEDLKGGAATTLVEDLEHERLAVRLLSYWNLRDITGAGQFYRPELSAAKRQQPVQRWRELLATGGIVRKMDAPPASR